LFKPWLQLLHLQIAIDDLQVLFGFIVEVFLKLMALMAVVNGFDGLFEAYSDEEADDDGGDVDEEVAPGGGGVMRWVDVEHWCGFLLDFGGRS
jgi:hypothetical protein